MKKILFIIFCFLASPAYAQIDIGVAGGVTGSWTPAVTASSTAGTPAYTTHVGSYVAIGNFVYAQFNIVLSGWTGSPSGNVSITGLPLTSTATTNDNGGCTITNYTVSALTASNWAITGVIAPSGTSSLLYASDVSGVSNVTAAETGTTPTFIGFCMYHI
jgi:hypothetical protein